MRKSIILMTILAFALYSCITPEKTEEDYYLETDFILVEKIEHLNDEDEPFIEFIIRTQEAPYQYRNLNNNCNCGYSLKRSTYHKYDVGDTLHFEYLLKSEFFEKANDSLIIQDSPTKSKKSETEELPTQTTKKSGEHTFTEPNF